MTSFVGSALFYPVSYASAQLLDLVRGVIDPTLLDTVEFTDESGGVAVRQLALPRLPGIDEVEVTQATLQIRSLARDMEISTYGAQTGPDGKGVFLTLDKPGRLKKVEVEYVLPTPVVGEAAYHVIVSSAKKDPSVLQPGTPLFAVDDFEPPGQMFPRTLAGMTQTALGGNRFLLNLPSVLGDAWLIQLAKGNSAVDLVPQQIAVAIRSVTLDGVPSNVAVTLATAGGDTALWSNPQLLLPSSGVQDISFTPLAQKELATALTPASADAVTLPLTVKFSSASGGALGIVARTLQARYIVRPVAAAPATITLAGARTPLTLTAPAGLQPQGSALRLVARCKGWELNGGLAEPPPEEPSTGLRVTQANMVAQSARFDGSDFPLVNVRLYLAAPGAAEVAVELREDVAGRPGAIIGKPVAMKIAGTRGWQDFACQPTPFRNASTALWVAARVTKGEVLWFAAGDQGACLISLDKGATWGAPELGADQLVLAAGAAVSRPYVRAAVARTDRSRGQRRRIGSRGPTGGRCRALPQAGRVLADGICPRRIRPAGGPAVVLCPPARRGEDRPDPATILAQRPRPARRVGGALLRPVRNYGFGDLTHAQHFGNVATRRRRPRRSAGDPAAARNPGQHCERQARCNSRRCGRRRPVFRAARQLQGARNAGRRSARSRFGARTDAVARKGSSRRRIREHLGADARRRPDARGFRPREGSAAQRQPGCQPRARRGEGPRARAGSAQAGRRQQVGARPAGAFLRPVSLAAILGACAPGRAGARRLSRPAFRRRAGRPAGEALRRIAGRIGSSRPCPAARTRAHGVARRICGPRAILGRRQCASRGCEYRLVRAGGEPPRRAAVAHRAAGEARPRHLAIGGQSQQPRFPGARSAQGRHRGHRPSARVPYRQDHGRHPQPHRGACHEPGELGADTGGAASGRQRAHRLVPAISRAKPARRAAQPAAALPPPHDVGDRSHSRSRRSLAMSRRRCFRSRTRLASSTPTWSASPFTSSSTRSSPRSRRFRSPTSRPRSGRCGTRSNPFCSRSTRSSLA